MTFWYTRNNKINMLYKILIYSCNTFRDSSVPKLNVQKYRSMSYLSSYKQFKFMLNGRIICDKDKNNLTLFPFRFVQCKFYLLIIYK